MRTKYTFDKVHMPQDLLDAELKQINPVCLDILYRRGYQTAGDIRGVLFPSLESALRPFTCKDIEPALKVLEDAVKNSQRIVVYRDYDVDGITAGALAVETLRKLGAPVEHYVNDRAVDGFGICRNGIENILKTWPSTKVILTVDNGITGTDAIEYARSKGLTVVVTDHHLPGESLPTAAAAIIDPKRADEKYPYRDLCGCGVIFRVMLELYRRMKKDPTPVFQTLDLVALATVADVVPLLGENRALVQEGLRLIEAARRPFFKLMAKAFDIKDISAHNTLSFQYVPALNALSRMGEDTSLALEALISTDETWVDQQVQGFKVVNQARKEKTQTQYEIAEALATPQAANAAIIVYSETFSEGIVGILAGRLKEKFWRPVIVLAPAQDGTLKGSGRSLDEFDLKAALDKCAPLLQNYGGHTKAAGLSLPAENLKAFSAALVSYANEALQGKTLTREVPLAAVLTEDLLTEKLVRDLRILEPFGEGFPEPVFGLIAAPDGVRYMGAESQHVKLTCSKTNLSVIEWNGAARIRGKDALPQKFVGKPSLNCWNGTVSVQFIQEPQT